MGAELDKIDINFTLERLRVSVDSKEVGGI